MNNERQRGGGFQHISQSLSETINDVLRPQDSQSSQAEKTTKIETRMEECECRTCGGKFQGEVTTYLAYQPPREVRPRQCSACCQRREEEELRQEGQERDVQRIALRERWRKECGIPWGLHCTRFEDFEPEFQRKALRLCQQYAEKFDMENPRDAPSLYLYSQEPGVGKTTLMACIATYLIDNWRGEPSGKTLPIRFENGPGLVRRVRATYNVPDAQKAHHETEEQVFAELCSVKLLMLDDLGKEKPSDFTRELYWYLIDRRISRGLPVIISSKFPLEAGGPLEELVKYDTVNRLIGMCRGKVVALSGTSYRTRKLVP